MTTDEKDDEVCCESREMRVDGWDAGDGHHTSVVLEKNEHGRWNLVAPEWFSVDVQFCPWCGKGLPKPEKFELGKEEEPKTEKLAEAIKASGILSNTEAVSVAEAMADAATEAEMDALLDSINTAVKGRES
jgi:hypothetical protein